MQALELRRSNGHLFAHIDGGDWLIDTGAPTSFGDKGTVELDGKVCSVPPTSLGLDAPGLSRMTEHALSGLLGADVLDNFDFLFDPRAGKLSVSRSELSGEGDEIELSECLGIPILEASIGGNEYRMFFDTGAKISYFQSDSLTDHPTAGVVRDFFPAFGEFETETYLVNFSIGEYTTTLRCGSLPGLLGMSLSLAGVEGIVGNELICSRAAWYFPRRSLLIIGL